MAAMADQAHIRNFSIIAHIDHGKSTLADRILELTHTVDPRSMRAQVLDSMDLERERGITIKAQAVRVFYESPRDGQTYQLQLIDTPGHVDFTYEVSRSLAACEGALLVVDASQGVEAQTVANTYLAVESGLELIPCLNKVDLPGAEPERVAEEVADLLGEPADQVRRISAKTGEGVSDILDELIARVPPPDGDPTAPPRALIFDSEFDQYRGVIAYIRVVDGSFTKGEAIRAMQAGTEAEIDDIGFFTPQMLPAKALHAGEVGFLITGIKDVTKLRVGDTLTSKQRPAAEPLPGYREVKPMVFCGLFPIESDDYPDLRDALEKLTLNDAALSLEPETSEALGFGFRCGFLGLLHMDIVRERLEREYDLELLATMPSVEYEVTLTDGTVRAVHSPNDMPEPARVAEVREPFIRASILTPKEFVGQIMELCQDRRGEHAGMHYLSAERVQLTYDLPLAEIVLDFFDQLKSRTRGYASLGLRRDRAARVRSGQARHPARRRSHRRPVDAGAPVQGPGGGAHADREVAREDPAPAVRRAHPGRHRLADRRPRDDQGLPQGRDRQVLRRRHQPQAQAARTAEAGQAADEAGGPDRGAPGGLPGGAGARRQELSSVGFSAELADQADPEIGQEVIRVRHDDGRVEELRLHDYERLYALPGVYEQIVHDRLGCRSPAELAALLARAADDVGWPRAQVRVLDIAAGNGVSGEALAAAGLRPVVGTDIVSAAREAALRDRPGLYDSYLILDLLRLTDAERTSVSAHRANALSCVAPVGDQASELPGAALVAAAGLLAPDALVVYLHDPHRSSPDVVTPDLWAAGLGERIDARELTRRRYVHRYTVNGAPVEMDGVVWRIRRLG